MKDNTSWMWAACDCLSGDCGQSPECFMTMHSLIRVSWARFLWLICWFCLCYRIGYKLTGVVSSFLTWRLFLWGLFFKSISVCSRFVPDLERLCCLGILFVVYMSNKVAHMENEHLDPAGFSLPLFLWLLPKFLANLDYHPYYLSFLPNSPVSVKKTTFRKISHASYIPRLKFLKLRDLCIEIHVYLSFHDENLWRSTLLYLL